MSVDEHAVASGASAAVAAAERWLAERLTPRRLAALARQGVVRGEPRRSGAVSYKLRYRDEQRTQRVLYVGSDPEWAAAVAEALIRRQAAHRERQTLRSIERALRQRLTAARRCARTMLAAAGYYFHGTSIRRRRRGNAPLTRDRRRRPRARQAPVRPQAGAGPFSSVRKSGDAAGAGDAASGRKRIIPRLIPTRRGRRATFVCRSRPP